MSDPCPKCGWPIDHPIHSPDCDEAVSALTAEVERLTREIDDALAVTRAPDSTNDGGPANLAETMKILSINFNASVAECVGLEKELSEVEEAAHVMADALARLVYQDLWVNHPVVPYVTKWKTK